MLFPNSIVFWLALELSVAAAVYQSSYIFINIKNRKSGQEATICGNFQQWQSKKIALSLETATAWSLKWYGEGRQPFDLCQANLKTERNMTGTVIPSIYRYHKNLSRCALLPYRHQLQYQMRHADWMLTGTEAALFLVEKGDVDLPLAFLFSAFKDPYLNDSDVHIFVFFTYLHRFQEQISHLGSENLELRFFRPSATTVDGAVPIISIIAIICVGLGGWWSGSYRKFLSEQEIAKQTELPEENNSTEASEEADSQLLTSDWNWCAIIFIIIIIIGTTLLLYFFHKYLVWVFIIILTTVSAFALKDCLSSLVELCSCLSCRVPYSAFNTAEFLFGSRCRCLQLPKTKPRLVDIFIFCGSLALSITWCVNRNWGYAFILQDLLLMACSIWLIKTIHLPSLKWVTVLSTIMVVFDVFMVFITPYITKDGCSIMMEAVTGRGCKQDTSQGVFAPPQDQEQYPMLIRMPRLKYPMLSCFDLSVDLQFPMLILGLGDIIWPGSLIGFCFGFDFMSGLIVPTYGLVSLLGYALGLCATFMGQELMASAQPALLYLLPSTLLFIIITALLRRELRKLWFGNWDVKTKHEDTLLNQVEEIPLLEQQEGFV